MAQLHYQLQSIFPDRMPKDIVDNTPTTYDPEHDALDYWEESGGYVDNSEKPRVLGPTISEGDIYLLPNGLSSAAAQ